MFAKSNQTSMMISCLMNQHLRPSAIREFIPFLAMHNERLILLVNIPVFAQYKSHVIDAYHAGELETLMNIRVRRLLLLSLINKRTHPHASISPPRATGTRRTAFFLSSGFVPDEAVRTIWSKISSLVFYASHR